MVHSGLDSVSVLNDHLIRLFAYHQKLVEANEAFHKMVKPSSYSWAAVILANTRLGHGETALDLYDEIGSCGLQNNTYIYVAALKSCAITKSLVQGRTIHHHIFMSRLQKDVIVGNTLVDMYAKCGSLEEACQVFKNLSNRDVISWNAIIAGHAQHGDCFLAVHYFQNMQQEGIKPDVVSWNAMITGYVQNEECLMALKYLQKMQQEGTISDSVTFLSSLKACASMEALCEGRIIHDNIIKKELQSNVVIASTLVDMYAKCKSLDEAQQLFHNLPSPNIVSWGAMIVGFTQNEEGSLALEWFRKMQQEGLMPNEVVFSSILKACGNVGIIEQGRFIHEQIITSSYSSDITIRNALVDMYAKCGSLEEACKQFDMLLDPNTVSWNSMIMGYVQNEHALLALECCGKMKEEGLRPNVVTFLNVLKGCSNAGALVEGRYLHERIVCCRLQSDLAIGSTLIDMYSNCGSLDEACHAFSTFQSHNIVSWSSLITGYAHYGESLSAAQCFENMWHEGIKPNEVSLTSMLTACSHAGLVDEGQWYYKSLKTFRNITPTISHCNCMISLLGRAGYLIQAESLLRTTMQTNIVGWQILLSACRMLGNFELGTQCFDQIVQLETCCAAGYVLMSNIYAGPI